MEEKEDSAPLELVRLNERDSYLCEFKVQTL